MLPDHIRITSEITKSLNEHVGSTYSQIAVVVDENTKKYCYPTIQNSLPPHKVIEIASGEKHKTIETCLQIWEQLTNAGFDRHALLITLGGGVIGDMGGFAAATYKRGIDFILVPTTLLSQVDASVGGKLGVDYKGYKNHIGLFQEPKATLIDPIFLRTLPALELRSGFAEIIKHTLIADIAQWDAIRQHKLETQNWDELIAHSIEFKAGVTEADPKEKGLRKSLNFGHTLGHAIETASMGGSKPLLHGEAIAIGMILEAQIAFQKGYINKAALAQVTEYVRLIFGSMGIEQEDKILQLIKHDKKSKENKILMALVKPLGHAVWDVEVSEEEIRNSLVYFHSF